MKLYNLESWKTRIFYFPKMFFEILSLIHYLNAFLWLHQIHLFLLNLTRILSKFLPWRILPWSSSMWLPSRTSSQPSFLRWTWRMTRIKDPRNQEIWRTFLLQTVCIFLLYSTMTMTTPTWLMMTKLVIIHLPIKLTHLLSSLYFIFPNGIYFKNFSILAN